MLFYAFMANACRPDFLMKHHGDTTTSSGPRRKYSKTERYLGVFSPESTKTSCHLFVAAVPGTFPITIA